MPLYPTPTNMSGMHGLFTHANSLTTDLFTPLILLAIVSAAFLLLIHMKYRTSDSVALSSLIAALLGAMLVAADLMDDKYVIMAIILLLIGLGWSIFDTTER